MNATRRSGRRWLALLVPAMIAWSDPVAAQGTALVPPTDLVYADLERLVALGALDAAILGQKPMSRRALQRLIQELHDRFDRGYRVGETESVGWTRAASDILQRVETRFGLTERPAEDLPVFSLVDAASLAFTATDATSRGFPGNLTRQTEAMITPLNVRRLGRQVLPGSTLAFEIQQRVEPTGWLAVRARERFEYRLPNDTTWPRHDEELLLASLRARFGNVGLTVGREQFAWSQTEDAGLFLASDAPALDQLSIASDTPFRLPGPFGRLGLAQATLLLADLGRSDSHSHSRLLAYKVSLLPHPDFEIGGTFMNHYGGTDSRKSSLGNRLVDFLPFIDIFRRHNYTDTSRTLDVESDKLLGVDARWRIGALQDVTLTGEVLLDDFDVHRFRESFTGNGSSQIAILFPRFGSREWSLKLSATHMGIQSYSHTQLRSGITTRGRLLGDELGPDAKAFAGQLIWRPFNGVRVGAEGRAAIYSNATYSAFYDPADSTRYLVNKVATGPGELRDRLLSFLEVITDEGMALVVRGGGERVRTFNFVDARRNEFYFDVALRLRM